MNYCTSCGTGIEEGHNFCSNCGTGIGGKSSVKQANGNVKQPPSYAEGELKCPNCSHSVSKVATECPNCGNKIKISSVPTCVASGVLIFLMFVAIYQEQPAAGIWFVAIMFALVAILIKRRFDKQLNLFYGNLVNNGRSYSDSILEEFILEFMEAYDLLDEEKRQNYENSKKEKSKN